MKRIINYTLLITALLVFTACKKRDEKLQKLIIGTWEVKPEDKILYIDYPDKLSFKYTFKEDGVLVEETNCMSMVNYYFSPSGGATLLYYPPCVTKYKIEKGKLFIEYQTGYEQLEWYEIDIKRLTKSRMVLDDLNDYSGGNWTYKKLN